MRWSDASIAAQLREALAAYHVAAHESPANISVLFGTSEGGIHRKHQLYVADQLRFTTLSYGRLLSFIVGFLEDIARQRQQPDQLRLQTLVVTHTKKPDGVVLIDGRLQYELDRIWPTLRRSGVRMIDRLAVYADEQDHLVDFASPLLDLQVPEEVLASSGQTDSSIQRPLPKMHLLGTVLEPTPGIPDTAPVLNAVPLARHPLGQGLTVEMAHRLISFLNQAPTLTVSPYLANLEDLVLSLLPGAQDQDLTHG